MEDEGKRVGSESVAFSTCVLPPVLSGRTTAVSSVDESIMPFVADALLVDKERSPAHSALSAWMSSMASAGARPAVSANT